MNDLIGVGAINSFGLGMYPHVDGYMGAGVILTFTPLVDDERVFTMYFGGKLTGNTVACPGRNEDGVQIPLHSEPLHSKGH